MKSENRQPEYRDFVKSAVDESLRWPDWKTANRAQIIAAALGLAGPVIAGSLVGQVKAGLIAAMGGLALGSAGNGKTFKEQTINLAYSLIAGTTAAFIGASLTGYAAFSAIIFPLLAGTIGLFGSISRSLLRATTQFILYCIIMTHYAGTGTSPSAITLLFFMGAIWTACLSLILRPLYRKIQPVRNKKNINPPPQYSAKQLLRRWAKSLARLAGWQYTLRITLCLAAGGTLKWLCPYHHSYWILVTIIIVLQRDLQAMLKRMLYRSYGTIAGVLLAGLLLICSLPVWMMITLVGLLAAGRVFLQETNYTAYAVIMTILVIVLLDFGTSPQALDLFDRLATTLIGCVLAFALGYWPWFRILNAEKQGMIATNKNGG